MIVIYTPMNRGNEGFILFDVILALLILSITLISVYPLIINSLKLEDKLLITMDKQLDSGEKYDENLKKNIK